MIDKRGMRLVDLHFVKRFLERLMQQQEAEYTRKQLDHLKYAHADVCRAIEEETLYPFCNVCQKVQPEQHTCVAATKLLSEP